MKTDLFNKSVRGPGGRLLCAAIILSFALPVAARVGTPPPSLQRQVQPLATIQQLALPPTDVAAELAADAKTGIQVPLRYAVGQKVEVTPATHGTWEQLPDGRLWRLRIVSAGATDLNLGFTTFWLPEGATLHVSAESEAYFQGPYTANDNKPHGQLWTPVVPGESAVIELFVPQRAAQQPRILLSQIGTGYRDLFHRQKDLTTSLSGPCEIDVVCPQAAPWTNEIRSVALYSIHGIMACTGTLLADTAGDFRNFFLTANHCGLDSINAASVVVYWNYQSPACGQHGGGSLAQNQSGAVFRAAKYDVDFALLELDDMPDPGFNVYYSGWNRSGTAPAGCVGIHHPGGGEKSISFSSNTLTTVNSCIGTGGAGTHWQVIWIAGVTEPGSSGSGIWDPATHLLVGTLSGGYSSCGNPTGPDCYGKLSVAWDSGTSPGNRLRDWLDPQNTGVTGVPGADPTQASILRPAGVSLVSESCSPANGAVDPGETVTVAFALKNVGGIDTTNLVATLLPTGGVVLPSGAQNYGVLTGGGSIVSRSFAFTATGVCGGTIAPVLQLQDGPRDLGTVTFGIALGVATPAAVLSQNFDGVVAPALPAGWTSSTAGGTAWATSTAQPDTPPNAVFAADPGAITDNRLISPSIAIDSVNAQLTFRHNYDLENGYDGGVLELSMNGGAFADILSLGGSFVTNGYNQTISTYYQNPLAGRNAWSGNSGGFVTTIVDLPPAAAGGTVQLRWRLGSDNSAGAVGWYVDSIGLTEPSYSCCTSLVQPVIMNPHLVDSNRMAFSCTTTSGQTYFLETRTDLRATDWTVQQTNAGDGSIIWFTNSTMESKERYFRLRTQ
jgi:Trypsin-like peptidase domain